MHSSNHAAHSSASASASAFRRTQSLRFPKGLIVFPRHVVTNSPLPSLKGASQWAALASWTGKALPASAAGRLAVTKVQLRLATIALLHVSFSHKRSPVAESANTCSAIGPHPFLAAAETTGEPAGTQNTGGDGDCLSESQGCQDPLRVQ